MSDEVGALLDFAGGRVLCGNCGRKHNTNNKLWRKCADAIVAVGAAKVWYDTRHLKYDPNYQQRGIDVRVGPDYGSVVVDLLLGINPRLFEQLRKCRDGEIAALSSYSEATVKCVKSVPMRLALTMSGYHLADYLNDKLIPDMFIEARAMVNKKENKARDMLDAYVTAVTMGVRRR